MEQENYRKESEISNEDTITGLYVACRIVDDFDVLEEFEQYVTFGRCLHNLVVFPKRVLLYTKLDEQGNLVYYDANTDKMVEIMDASTPLYSYETEAGLKLSLLQHMKNSKLLIGRSSFDDGLRSDLVKMYNQYGLVTSFETFYEQKFGSSIENVSLKKAKTLLKLLNLIIKNKPIVLSTNPEIAAQQLEKIGYVPTENKIKHK